MDRDDSPGRAAGSSTDAVALAHAIEREILPRLLVSHGRPQLACAPSRVPEEAERDALLSRAAESDFDGAFDVVVAALDGGVSLDGVLLDLVAQTARTLGDQWLDDTRSFASVTTALGVLQVLASRLGGVVDDGAGLPVALLAPVPGEQHTLGLIVAAEFFRRAGCLPRVELNLDVAQLLDCARDVAVVGLSVSGAASQERLVPTVQALRAVLPTDAVIAVGGGCDAAGLSARLQAAGLALCAPSSLVPTAKVPDDVVVAGFDVNALSSWLQVRVRGSSGVIR
jgi:hypothetical protein